MADGGLGLLPYEELRRQVALFRDGLRRAAPESLAAYMVAMSDSYRPEWFHREVARRCERLLAGESSGLMVFMPPQHGKSEIVSRSFPAWALGRDPKLKVAGCSYSADLAVQFSRAVRRSMESEEYALIFPKSGLGGVNNADYFETEAGGFYKAVGVCGPLTGTPVDLAIVDDPVKDSVEASSQTYRDRVWEWYNTVLCTRLHNRSRKVLIMTRWHDDDLAGRILRTSRPGEWDVLRVPALCVEAGDGCGSPRAPGDPLWPARHSLESLLERRDRSPLPFAALYQQEPALDGGNVFRRETFRHWTRADLPARFDRVVQSWDFTFKKGEGTDNVCGTVWGVKGPSMFLLAQVCRQMDYVEQRRAMREMMGAHPADAVYVEAAANGEAILSDLGREFPRLVPVKVRESKMERAQLALPCFEAGNIWFPESAPWLAEYEDELTKFPKAAHDDRVDSTTMAINKALGGPDGAWGLAMRRSR